MSDELKDQILRHLRAAIQFVEKDASVMADEEITGAKSLMGDWFWKLKDKANQNPTLHSFSIVMPGTNKPTEAK
jgi:hypothetical protein